MAVPFSAVRHEAGVRAFNPALVERIERAGGHLVLVENNPHWDMISDRTVRTETSRFDVHYESLLPGATGKLFYGQPQDGYHRSRFRGHSLAGGGFRGQAIETVPTEVFVSEMRRWGVESLLVWSDASRRYLSARPEFVARGEDGDWAQFELTNADPRAVVTVAGTGSLVRLTPVSGEVTLRGVPPGSRVVVRTHFHPAWSASADGRPVPLTSEDGQIAFAAPAGGDVVVRLAYDRRIWLTLMALTTLICGAALLAVRP